MSADQGSNQATEHEYEQMMAGMIAADLAEQMRNADPDDSATYPQEWTDGADPAEWDDYTAPAPGDSRYLATIWHDPDTSINDYDCHGRVSYSYSYSDRAPRPDWADGAARKIQVDRGSWVWWQPYREGRKVYDSPEEVRRVRDLLEMGFQGVTIERQQLGPCGHWHRAEIASLGGIDSFDNGYLAEVLANLIDEVRPTT